VAAKYIFVTGGVLSGLGKGIVAASLGNILKARGFRVSLTKVDPYLNYDAGTLNPGEHGEVFVTDDGAETDLDLGHYERFINENLHQENSIMNGRVYQTIINKERHGDFLGKTVQIIPHLTQLVRDLIVESGKKNRAEVLITEVGGTVGDYEGLHFLEAIRQMKEQVSPRDVMYFHVVFLPFLETSKEVKSRPAQYSVRELQGVGIQPDVVVCRSDHSIPQSIVQKISKAVDLPGEAIVPLETSETVYEVPLILENYGVGDLVARHFKLPRRKARLDDWQDLVAQIIADKPLVRIGLVAKYTTMEDTYLSVFEALKAAAWYHNHDVEIKWINAEHLEEPGTKVAEFFYDCDGIVVPGGFGSRGIEGKIKAIQYAREHQVPFLGLCLGMQLASIEFARNVLGLKDAHSTEFNETTPDPVIHIMEYQKTVVDKGGTMRLGLYPCRLRPGSRAREIYGESTVEERHRHRYEFNNDYRKPFEEAGMTIVGVSPNQELVELIELKGHPFFMASQFHPEFKSRPNRPHPLFKEFIGAAIKTGKLLEG